jgi:hypothetical protein
MKNAYLILAHKNPEQICTLIDELIDEESCVLLHIDGKCGLSPNDFPTKENLWTCKDRVNVNWAGFSQIKATLRLIHLLFELSLPVDYVHLLSGQDFSIQPKRVIHEFFRNNIGRNFIDCHSVPVKNMGKFRGNLDKIEYFWEVDRLGNKAAYEMFEKRQENSEKRIFPVDYIPYSGSQWWSLHIDSVAYIHKNCVPGSVLYDFYENTYVPDEMYFQTVIMNSPFKETVVPNNYRYIEWLHDVGRSSVLLKKDYFKMVESSCFFARKFDAAIDQSVLDYLRIYIHKKHNALH